jgi:Flp pilus assembly protein TadG
MTDERGSTTATVIVFPVVLALIMLVLQFALAFHGKQVLTAAAQDGNRAAQAAAGDAAVARTQARELVADDAQSFVHGVDVDVELSPDGQEITTVVAGDVVRLLPIPGLRLHVTGRASGPVEEFRPEDAG